MTFIVADTPDAPTNAPASDLTETTGSQIKVDYASLLSSENGGADISSYELQMYNKETGTWECLIGGLEDPSLSNSYTVTEGLKIGETFEFRYRAYNVNGAGDFSNIGYLVAAEEPSQPFALEHVESDDTSVTLSFRPPASDGGSIVTKYILEYSEFTTLNWQPITSYTDNSMSHKVTTLTPNVKYRFRIKCENDFRTSDPSSELVVVIASLPSKPDPVTKDQSRSSKFHCSCYLLVSSPWL